jgi:exopolysaccharide biosynthesis polyprenyl glycosylphosphotransferase
MLGGVTMRSHQRFWALAIDVIAALVAYEIAVVVFASARNSSFSPSIGALDWGLLVAVALIIGSFTVHGLYKLEVWVSRPLHFMVLLRATVTALIFTAFVAFVFKAPFVSDSRLTVFTAFGLFFVITAITRLRFLDKSYVRDVRERPGATLIVGWSSDGGILISRLRELRGFAEVRTLQPADRRRNGYPADPGILETLRTANPVPRNVFLDGSALGHQAALELISAARARGTEVYVTGRLVSPLDATGLLMRLFQLPVMRVHSDPAAAVSPSASRALRLFDVVASGAALVLLSPVFAVIALAIERDSPGPVYFRQERVGRYGKTFQFLKFRSMTVGNDAREHREAVTAFIDGQLTEEMAQTDEYGRPVFKLAGDARVTRVGRVLRKYSLDELPQFWNVFKGDMSMVGPRPALPYEVKAYKEWHRARLQVTPGVSGLWQIAGRSRVDFDDMVFQDVVYGYNQSLLTDIHICVRTLPAVFMGSGAA